MGIVVSSHPFLVVLLMIYLYWSLRLFRAEGFSFAVFNLLVLTLPFNNTVIIPILNVSLPTVMLLISVVISLANSGRFLTYIRSINFEELFLFELVCLVFLVFCVALFLFDPDRDGLRGLIIVLGWAAIFMLPLRQIYTVKRLKYVFVTIAISLFTITIISLLQQFLIIPFVESINGTNRVMGALRGVETILGLPYRSALFGFVSYGEYGIWLSASMGMVLSSLKYKLFRNHLQRLGLILLLLIMLLATWTMQSRSTWIAIITILIFFIAAHLKISRHFYLAFSGIGVVAGLLLLSSFGSTELVNRIFLFRTNTVFERLESYGLALNTFYQSPLLGVGIRKFQFFSTIIASNIDVHNTLISYLVGIGILGIIPVLLITLLIVNMLLKLRKKGRNVKLPFTQVSIVTCFAIFIGLIIESMFFPGSHNKIISLCLGIINATYALSLSPAWNDKF